MPQRGNRNQAQGIALGFVLSDGFALKGAKE